MSRQSPQLLTLLDSILGFCSILHLEMPCFMTDLFSKTYDIFQHAEMVTYPLHHFSTYTTGNLQDFVLTPSATSCSQLQAFFVYLSGSSISHCFSLSSAVFHSDRINQQNTCLQSLRFGLCRMFDLPFGLQFLFSSMYDIHRTVQLASLVSCLCHSKLHNILDDIDVIDDRALKSPS
jgi:hypothetical protein